MIRICSYCCEVFGEKEPFENKEETHGICPKCLPIVIKEFKNQMKVIKEVKKRHSGLVLS